MAITGYLQKTGFPIFHSYRPLPIKKSKIDDTPNTDNHWIKDINFDLITRAAVVYNTNKYFIGASLVMHTYDYRKKTSPSLILSELSVYIDRIIILEKKEFRDK